MLDNQNILLYWNNEKKGKQIKFIEKVLWQFMTEIYLSFEKKKKDKRYIVTFQYKYFYS